MFKSEFEKLVGCEVSVDEYEMIEFVYTHHPLISEVEGKKQVAMLFKTFGCAIFLDMMPKAEKAKQTEDEILKLRGQISALQEQVADKMMELEGMRKFNKLL